MKSKPLLNLFTILCIVYNLIPADLWGYSLRNFSSRNGLSNSAIQAICQDGNGFMWFGSCDGLNRFDGLDIEVYKPTNENNLLSGNLIETIIEGDDGFLWVQTNYGLDLFDSKRKVITTYPEFNSKNHIAISQLNDLYILYEDNHISYFDRESLSFHKKQIGEIAFEQVLDVVMDNLDVLWIFTKDHGCQTYRIEKRGNDISFVKNEIYQPAHPVLYCFHEGYQVYFVDNTYDLFEMDLNQMKVTPVFNLATQIKSKGEISSIIRHHGDFYIGFKSSGLIQLQEAGNHKEGYKVNEIDIRSGIFCLVKDRYQDVIWVGTDGQGVFMYYINSFTLRSNPLNTLTEYVGNPVRALQVDTGQDLWVGTKGDGIIRIKGYGFDGGIAGKEMDYLHTGNSALTANSVYAFSESKRPLLWIGTEEGMNYYSFKEKKIKTLRGNRNEPVVRYVHSIREVSDTVLWVATVGEGIVKITLAGTPGEPVIASTKRFVIDGGIKSSNYFFSSYVENDSIIWFANRGLGAFRFNVQTEQYTNYTFGGNTNNRILDDVFAITKNKDGYWFGTSFGLVRLHEGDITVFNEAHGFPNHTVHSILPDGPDELWLSTNQGVIRFNTQQLTFQTFREYHETAVTEFSDGAFWQDASTGNILFGGINGFLAIQKNDYHQREYMPTIQFNNLSIFGKEYNIYEFLNENKKKPTLELNYSQNFFTVSFAAIDYIHGNDYTWLYKLDELSDTWVENGKSGIATFTNISPGTYTLSVKYRNHIVGKESETYSLLIRILPPWYQTTYAYFVYFCLFLSGLWFAFRLTRTWYELKKTTMIEKLTRQQKEEIYESKLRFFTNITHELCTPLTLIYGPCERIISYQKSDSYVQKYASLIRQNVEKLNALIQELIEFRRLETGHLIPKIGTLSLSEILAGIADSFYELAETRGIDYILRIPEEIHWNSDAGCVNKIVTNLISNAFKYTPEHGQVIVCLTQHEKGVCIEISNTGKEIPADRIKEIFDRYKILDTFELQTKQGVSSRNGLGLAICHSMVHVLEGEIEVESANGMTTFRVILPPLQKSEDPLPIIAANTIPVIQEDPVGLDSYEPHFDHKKPTLMIVEDDPSMLWFITEIFVDKYNVIPLEDSREVEEILKTRLPDLVISDVMMPEVDGISLTRFLKGNKFFSHIPVILLSAKIDAEEQVKGIESGADVYITKPFNVKYLEKLVERFLHQKDNLKEYYGSAVSAYQLNNSGQLVHKEDKAIFDKILSIIDENINNPDLNVELISSSLGISTRQLYRRIKTVTEQTPSDLIKEQRLKMTEHLLITTTLSVDEIIYKTGYTNRGNFFRVFSARYGMTPKQFRQQKKEELEKRPQSPSQSPSQPPPRGGDKKTNL